MVSSESLMELRQAASQFAHALFKQKNARIVLAESCTAGLVSSTLAQIPGISDFLCGSAVTYRNSVKSEWLDVPESDIAEQTSVSQVVSEQMAIGVLNKTSEAVWSAGITGHLGPNAPLQADGMVFLAIAKAQPTGPKLIRSQQVKLKSSKRLDRQHEAAAVLLRLFTTTISE